MKCLRGEIKAARNLLRCEFIIGYVTPSQRKAFPLTLQPFFLVLLATKFSIPPEKIEKIEKIEIGERDFKIACIPSEVKGRFLR